MKVLKAIIIASLSIPALVFIFFLVGGLAILVSELIQSGNYSNGWLGIVAAGAMYSYFAALLSTIPTVVFGLPISLVALRYGVLNDKVILVGAAVIGGIFLGIAALLFLKASDFQLLLWAFFAGVCGGLMNGYIFLRSMKPNTAFERDAPKAACPSI